MNKNSVVISMILFTLAILLGAFGAHGLEKIATPKLIDTFETGVKYQFYISLLTLIVGFNQKSIDFNISKYLYLIWGGLFLFSGSIYFIVFSKIYGFYSKVLIPITPLGGVLLIVGCLLFIFKLLQKKG